MTNYIAYYSINSYTHVKYKDNYVKESATCNMNVVQPHAEGHSASQWVCNLLRLRLALKCLLLYRV